MLGLVTGICFGYHGKFVFIKDRDLETLKKLFFEKEVIIWNSSYGLNQ